MADYKKLKSKSKGYGKEIDVDYDFVVPYFQAKKFHKNYLKAEDVAFHIQFHATGYFQKPVYTEVNTSSQKTKPNPYFVGIVNARRPNEDAFCWAHRRMIYRPITKDPIYKVINSLKKIVRSADWKIDYTQSEVPPQLPTGESLQTYCEEVYPYYDSVENWAYTQAMRWMLVDPNAMCVVVPLSFEVQDNEFFRPVVRIVQSRDVYDYKENELAVWLSSDVTSYKDEKGQKKDGKIICIMTTMCYYEALETSQGDFELVSHPHNIGALPCFLMGGENTSSTLVQPFYESFLSPMLPTLDQVAGENSDLEAACVFHMYPEKWEIQSDMCSACDGTGWVPGSGNQTICTAPNCTGGRVVPPNSPYRVHLINLNTGPLSNPNAKDVPIPPTGYIDKPVEIVQMMIDKIDSGLFKSLAAVNMEFLSKSPIAQSGVSKAQDRDESNNFIYSVGQWLVQNIIEQVYWFTNEWMYNKIVPDAEVRMKGLPRINVPENFDFLYEASMVDDAIKIAGSDLSYDVKEQDEMDFIHKKYQENPEVKQRMSVIQKLQPLPGLSMQDIQTGLTAGIITKVSAVKAVYLKYYVSILSEQNEGFFEMDITKQRQMLDELVQSDVEAMEEADAQKQKTKHDNALALAEAKTPDIDPFMAQPDTQGKRIDAKQQDNKPGKDEKNALTWS